MAPKEEEGPKHGVAPAVAKKIEAGVLFLRVL